MRQLSRVILFSLAAFCCLILLDAPVSAQRIEVQMASEDLLVSGSSVRDTQIQVHGFIRNLTADTVMVSFKKIERMPTTWNTNVCFGVNCFAERVDSAAEAWSPFETKALKLYVNLPPSPRDSSRTELRIYAPEDPAEVYVSHFSVRSLPFEPISCRVLRLLGKLPGEVQVDSVSVSDPATFSARSTYDLPTYITSKYAMDVEVCIKPTDGLTYSTTVQLHTSGGLIEYPVTLQAPLPANVHADATTETGAFRHSIRRINGSRMEWNITASAQQNMDATVAIVDLKGAQHFAQRAEIAAGECAVDLPSLPPGLYFLSIVSGSTKDIQKYLVP